MPPTPLYQFKSFVGTPPSKANPILELSTKLYVAKAEKQRKKGFVSFEPDIAFEEAIFSHPPFETDSPVLGDW
jgi:hypothetical protein